MWQVQYFSNWMTRMLHTSRRVQDEQPAASEPDRAGFDYHMQLGQLHNLVETPPAIAQLATFYTGLPLLG
jgi:hypothetical protein